MDVIIDGLLIAGTFFAGAYCWVLSRRVQALKALDSGLGGAIVTLTRQIELARATLEEARAASSESRSDLADLVKRSDAAAGQLRLLLAASKEPVARARSRSAPPAPPAREPAPERFEEEEIEDVREAAPPARGEVRAARAAPAALSLIAPLLPPRRRDAAGPRLVSLPQIEAPTAETASETHERKPAADAVPKPRRTLAPEGVLRSRAEAVETPSDEEALIAALTAMAAGGER